jgi:hypothetical protein
MNCEKLLTKLEVSVICQHVVIFYSSSFDEQVSFVVGNWNVFFKYVFKCSALNCVQSVTRMGFIRARTLHSSWHAPYEFFNSFS